MATKLRVAVVSTQVFPCPPRGYAGTESIAYHCAGGLARRGHQVLLIAPDGSRCDGCQVLHTGPPGAWDESQAYDRYWQSLLGVDVVISHDWSKPAFRLKMEGRLKAPVLAVMHAPVDTMYRSLPPVEKFCAVLISEDQKNHFEAIHGRPGRVCYNGVDVGHYAPAAGVKRNGRALFLGRFSTIKGPDIAVRACHEAGLGLDLVGDTSITNEPDYLRAVLAASEGKDVAFHGADTRDGCVLRMSAAHVFLHPNERFREPFGLAPVESMLCQTPVIAYRRGAMSETVLDGVTGRLCSSYDEFLHAVRTSGEWVTDKVRSDCRDWARRFSVENMAARYEELCHEALQGGW